MVYYILHKFILAIFFYCFYIYWLGLYYILNWNMEGTDEGLILAQKFKILKKIGSGSFGYIYSCT